MLEVIYILFALPPVFAVLTVSGVLGSGNVLHWLNRLTATAAGGVVVLLAQRFTPGQPFNSEYVYLDALSFWVLLIVTTLYVAAAWASKSYLLHERNREYLSRSPERLGRYYALFQMFAWTMFLVLVVKNLGLMWVAIEATTLVSAFLVAFKFNRGALEATWKYVMVCTVGICLALLGTMILYYAQISALGAEKALSWLWLTEHAAMLNPSLTKLAFLFIFIGYGTKIGMAPMHTWLPDAYAEAPSLTSGLLSGALCTCAIYVLLRNIIVVMPTVGVDFISTLCLSFATLTIAIAVPFVVVQRDVKRMLAYSSMENIGLMIAGIGVFSQISIGATLVHMFNHALIKFVLFYIAGTIVQEYQTKNMMRIHGMIGDVPHTATFWLLGIIGILGMPPLGLFFSKFYILYSLFLSGHYLLGCVIIVLLAGILIGILYHAMRMLCDKAKRKPVGDLLDCVDTPIMAALLLGSIVIGAGISQIPYLEDLLAQAVRIVGGGQF
ncbi:proton-conducting transporter membrane subunit [uncultured Phascolarctobacterium sp.]|uniref:proton-conducting transporter transmembrane domain-containing protein n=1 Tax=Phascolarctobacterium sp. TaxID=2049039 RepID=UPI0025CB97D5|nr:proton-conducting transporter membrane subunit [uncultured Phascolarctobacterium sp.]